SQKSSEAVTSIERPQSANARSPASSLDSKRSAGGMVPPSAASAAPTSSSPHPLYGSRHWPHRRHPLPGVMSAAVRSSTAATWSGRSEGRDAISSAAVAETSAAAYEVPSAVRNSAGPQSE